MKRKHAVWLAVGITFGLAVLAVGLGIAVDHASRTPLSDLPGASLPTLSSPMEALFPDVAEGMDPADVIDTIGRIPDRIENGPGATLSVWEYDEGDRTWSVVFTDGVVSAAFEGSDSLAEEQARQGVGTTTGSDGPYYAESS